MVEQSFWDEMTGGAGDIRAVYARIDQWLRDTPPDILAARRSQAELLFRRIGITFAVYGSADAAERLIPFDIIPRVIAQKEWHLLEEGLIQRVKAINAFLTDIYGPREILRAGVIPADLVFQNPAFRPEMSGRRAPHDIWVHSAGIDVVRTGENEFYVLEDNARTPSGVSYMLENRDVMMRLLPDLFAAHRIAPVENYTDLLLNCLRSVAPPTASGEPCVALLTPGQFNSAYYEHSFLADLMGIELVEPQDLFVENGLCWMRTTRGPQRVDVIYRRIDDTYIDPLAFKADSLLGVPGIFDVYRSGGVTLCSAPGAGVADDKAIYVFVPDMIKFYLGEKPILENVQTWRCAQPDDCKYVLENLKDLVIKRVHGSGGYGMLIGPHAAKKEIDAFRAKIKANPNEFIAQPTLDLSTAPILGNGGIEERHVDFRPYCLVGKEIRLTPGGLTRVALKKGSLVVNSSQGGGVKDTWILAE